jgi:hypothetical protein
MIRSHPRHPRSIDAFFAANTNVRPRPSLNQP